jgi:predicted transposase/invertase (TIGR01784 family)
MFVKVQSVGLGFCFPVFDSNSRLLTRSLQLYPEAPITTHVSDFKDFAKFGNFWGIEPQKLPRNSPSPPTVPVWREYACGGLDGVFLPPEDAESKVVFFAEVQFQKDQLLYHRFFSELFLYLYRNQTRYDDWYGVLIFPSRSLEPDDSTMHRALLNSSQVQRLYLDELGDANEQPIGISLVLLTIQQEDRTVEQAKQLIARAREEDTGSLSREAIIDIVTTIAVYKFASFSREEVEAMLGLSIEQTRVYQEAKEEGRQEGRQEEREQLLAATVPLLLQTGMTIEEIAEQIGVEVEVVRQSAQRASE